MNTSEIIKMLRDALAHAESVYRLNVVKNGEPSSTLQNMQAVLAATAELRQAVTSAQAVAVFEGYVDGTPIIKWTGASLPAGTELYAASAAWTPASSPPDADTTVMLALADGEVWQGYFDGANWIEVSGLQLAPGRVTYWQHTPTHPEDKA